MRLDVRRVQRAGGDGVVAVLHRLAGLVGQPFLGRGGGLLAGLLAVVLSLWETASAMLPCFATSTSHQRLPAGHGLPRGVHFLEDALTVRCPCWMR
mgnify:CR=1 FL=1